MSTKKDAAPIDEALALLEAEGPEPRMRSAMRQSIQASLPKIRKLVAGGYTVAQIARRIAESRGDKFETVRAYLHEALGPIKDGGVQVSSASRSARPRSSTQRVVNGATQGGKTNGNQGGSADGREHLKDAVEKLKKDPNLDMTGEL